MNDVVIFLPETGIYPYLRTLSVIAKSISNNITLLHCTGQMQCCNLIPSDNFNIDSNEKQKFCSKCNTLFCLAKKKYSMNSIEISDIITEKKINEIESLIPKRIEDCINFKYKDFSVGLIAEYDLVLKTKFLDINNISDKYKQIYYKYLFNAVIAVEITDYICHVYKPNHMLAFNPYTINQAACFVANKNNVKFNYITNNSFMGADCSAFLISNRLIGLDYFDTIKTFENVKSFPLVNNYVGKSWDDAFFRFYGTDGHIFSSSKNKTPEQILYLLNLKKNKRTVIAFTSSNDEVIAAELSYKAWGEKFPFKNVFSNQIEWIDFLKNYAESHKDTQIVVRIHPREGSRQNGIPSEHLLLLKEHFKNKDRTENFIIIWADNLISSYDLLELADLCLANWSTMGQECARVGIPVLSYTRGGYYIKSKSFFIAESVTDYENKMNYLLDKDYSLDMLQDAIRYNYWRTFIMSVDCSDTLSRDCNDESYWPVLSSIKAQLIKDICLGNVNIVDYNKKKWFSQITENSEEEEIHAILKGISDFYYKVFITKEISKFEWFIFLCLRKFVYIITKKRKLLKLNSIRKTSFPKSMFYQKNTGLKTRIFNYSTPVFCLEKDNVVVYSFKGKKYKRYSPLLWKLGKLYKDAMDNQ